MANFSEERSQMLTNLGRVGRGWSDAIILFHSTIAQQFGLNATEWKCGGILDQQGPMTAGELAKATGLTTGAITGIVDRLEQTGFVSRQPDLNDRRRVMLHPINNNHERIEAIFNPFLASMAEALSTYSDQDIALIIEFMERAIQIMNEQAAQIRRKQSEEG